MRVEEDAFLKEVAQMTALQGAAGRVLRLTSAEEIVAAASVRENSGSEPVELGRTERFHYEIYTELFDDISYRIRQLKSLFYSDFSWRAVKRCEERLLQTLYALETGIQDYYRFVEARLICEKEDDVRAAVFVLASVRSEPFASIYLDRVIKAMAGAEETYLPCFADALKLGLNDGISSRLDMITGLVSQVVKAACLEIIDHRRHHIIDLLYRGNCEPGQACVPGRQNNRF